MDKINPYLTLIFLTLLVFVAGCTAAPSPTESMQVSLIVDGNRRSWAYDDPITVGEFLDEVGVELAELDDITPPLFTQIADGMLITIVRVEIEDFCEERPIPYQTQRVQNESLEPGQEVIFEPGNPGEERICYRVQVRDDVRQDAVPAGQPTVLTEPQNEIIHVGPTRNLDPVDIDGTLAYVSSNNAWIMQRDSGARRRLTGSGDVDTVGPFSLSPDGNMLLFTRFVDDEDDVFNELWIIPDVGAIDPQPIKLRPTNVLYADWVPGSPNTISYSRGEPRDTNPGWRALNDLWQIQIDPTSGNEINIDNILEEAPNRGGPYSWWGRKYVWSPDGTQLVWIHADAVGMVDLEAGDLNPPIITYDEFTPRSNWSWRATVSWSPDSSLIATTTHGPPIQDEDPTQSPVFNVTMASTDGDFQADLVEQAGIWSVPKFSPLLPESELFSRGYIAYMAAREPLNSVGNAAEYDLYVADRDGSNAQRVFPPDGQRGLTSRDYDWGPDGDEIVVVYQGNLWLVYVDAAIARQLTLDGNASNPVWSR